MTRLAPASFELHIVAAATILAGGARSAGILAGGRPDDLRAVALGLVACVIGLWGLWGARAVRRAVKLALPVGPGWSPEDRGATLARVLAWQVVPLCAVAFVGSVLAAERVDAAVAAAAGAGALTGVGITALLAARRVRRAEGVIGRRLWRQPRAGLLPGRASLFIEPAPLAPRRGGPVAPWPVHRPAPRAQQVAIELEPSNPAARHPVGVTARPPDPPRAQRRLSPPGPGAG